MCRGCPGVAVVLFILLGSLCLPAQARIDAARLDAIGLPYAVDIGAVGDAALDAAVERSSMLVALRDDAAVAPLALIARAEADVGRIDDVLRSFGYYDAVIEVRVDSVDLTDPSLPQALAARTGRATAIAVRIDPGPLYRLAVVEVEGDLPGAATAAFGLRSGEPAEARRVLTAGADMLDALREDGFALARVPPPRAVVDHRTRTMDVRYVVEPGPRVAIGAIEIAGLERLREPFVRRRLGLQPGEPYRPSRLEAARGDLLASEAVAAVRITPAPALDADGRLPLRIDVMERKPRTLRLSGAFASDEGASVLLGWTHRNLFGGAERLSVRGEVGSIDSTARDSLDFAAGASLRLPDRWRRDQAVVLDLGAVSESLDAYDRDAVTAGAGLEQRLSPPLSIALGAAFERSRIVQDGPAADFRLLSLPLTLGWEAVDEPLDPRRGLRFQARLVPVPWVDGDGEPFARADIRAAGYLDLTGLGPVGGLADALAAAGAPRRPSDRAPDQPAHQLPDRPPDHPAGPARSPPAETVLAGRLALGRIIGVDASAVPADWRLYAGGAGSVRGYPLQSIGPRTVGNAPAGGDALLEGSLELRRRLGGPWGVVAFADAASVTADGLADLDDIRVGVGLGVRFHTVIGPLRADLAVPLDPYPGDAPVQVYLGIGQAF